MARDSKQYGYKFLLWAGEDPADQLTGFEGTIVEDGFVRDLTEFSEAGLGGPKFDQASFRAARQNYEEQFSQWKKLLEQLAPGDHLFLDSLARIPMSPMSPHSLISNIVIKRSVSLSFVKEGFEFSPDTIADDRIWKFLEANNQARDRAFAEHRIRWMERAAKADRYKNNGRKQEIDYDLVMELLDEGLKPDDFKAAKGWSKASIFRIKKNVNDALKGRERVSYQVQLDMGNRLRDALIDGSVKNFSDWLKVLESEFPDVISKGEPFWAKERTWQYSFAPETGLRYLEASLEERKTLLQEVKEVMYRHGPPSFDPDRAVYLVNEGLTEDQICEIMGLTDSGPLYFFLAMKKYEGPFIETATGKAMIAKAREMINSMSPTMGIIDAEDQKD